MISDWNTVAVFSSLISSKSFFTTVVMQKNHAIPVNTFYVKL